MTKSFYFPVIGGAQTAADLSKRFGLARSGRDGAEGRPIPQPQIRTYEGRRVLLDDILGEDFVLLGYAADPRAGARGCPRYKLRALYFRRSDPPPVSPWRRGLLTRRSAAYPSGLSAPVELFARTSCCPPQTQSLISGMSSPVRLVESLRVAVHRSALAPRRSWPPRSVVLRRVRSDSPLAMRRALPR